MIVLTIDELAGPYVGLLEGIAVGTAVGVAVGAAVGALEDCDKLLTENSVRRRAAYDGIFLPESAIDIVFVLLQ